MIGLRMATGLALALGPLLFTAASAETVKLLCGDGLYVRIDMDASTAGSVASADLISQIQMYPATITGDEVTWTTVSNGYSPPATFTLDRHSGALTLFQYGQTYQRGTCKKDNQDILSN